MLGYAKDIIEMDEADFEEVMNCTHAKSKQGGAAKKSSNKTTHAVIYTKHAESRMKTRRINKDQILQAIKNCKGKIRHSNSMVNIMVINHRITGKEICVIAAQSNGQLIVITAYWGGQASYGKPIE